MQGIVRRVLALVVGVSLAAGVAGTVVAGEPTVVAASPSTQNIGGCQPSAQWTVYLGGGTSGAWTVHTRFYYGGSYRVETVYSSSYVQGYTFPVSKCHFGSSYDSEYQTRYASRAGGGTSPNHYTYVHIYE